MAIILNGDTGTTTPGLNNTGITTLGDASGDALTINSSAVSIPNGLNFGSNNLVLSGGNVGIGTSSPSARLQVSRAGGSAGSGNLVYVDVTSSFGGISVNSIANNNTFVELLEAGTKVGGFNADTTNNITSLQAAGGHVLAFNTDNTTERMRIDANGSVGIGTASPTSALGIARGSGASAFIEIAANGNTLGSTSYGLGQDSNGTAYIFQRANTALLFGTNNAERLRIDTSGNLLLASDSLFYGMGLYTNKKMMQFSFPPGGQFGAGLDSLDFATPGNGSGANQMRITQQGNVGCRGSFSGGQTLNDYAEYFEWSDGNPFNEDRIGVTVVLDNGQIRPSAQSDVPSSIIGVVSGTAGVVLGSAPFEWSGKYQKDEFGRIKTYYETWINWTDESGSHNYKQGEVPSDVVVPDTANTKTYQKELLSENYNESVNYANREQRPEWACIGLVGQVHVKKGQVVGDRWIKMKDVSNNVEMWFIR